MSLEALRKILQQRGWCAAPLVADAGEVAVAWIPPGGEIGQAILEDALIGTVEPLSLAA